ncbi:MAG: type II toxin-antitoxin system PemK/MazF family toxin [Thermoleophilia bacterium]|nr:type II toxin-antitoxin system PemK/MazF family toxin [Thermoleophilia bacterium]
MVRGEIFRLSAPRGRVGHEQEGARYAIVVQADEMLGMSTAIIAPTSTSARPAMFRPVIDIDGSMTRVMIDHTQSVDVRRLGRSAGRLDAHELRAIDDALTAMLGL